MAAISLFPKCPRAKWPIASWTRSSGYARCCVLPLPRIRAFDSPCPSTFQRIFRKEWRRGWPSKIAPFSLPAAPAPSLFDASDKIVGDTLLRIREDLGKCTRCKLHKHRHTIVFGDGNPKAELVFVGEGPGADEDAQGLPFVGRAGKLLTQMIEAMGLQRKDVYICNVVK